MDLRIDDFKQRKLGEVRTKKWAGGKYLQPVASLHADRQIREDKEGAVLAAGVFQAVQRRHNAARRGLCAAVAQGGDLFVVGSGYEGRIHEVVGIAQMARRTG